MRWAIPRLGQISASGHRTLFSGESELWTTFDRMERIRTQEYSNSCPHFRHTWYVRFLIVNTPLLWR
jgi:hypothetical protein